MARPWRRSVEVPGSQKRRDVETSPGAPCVVPSLQMVLIRRSGLSKQWDPLPSSLCDLSSKEATQSLAPLLLGCLGQTTLDCVLTTMIWQNHSNKETNPRLTRQAEQRTQSIWNQWKTTQSYQHKNNLNSKLRIFARSKFAMQHLASQNLQVRIR